LGQGAPWPEEQIERGRNRREFFSRTFWARLGRTLSGQTAEIPFVQGQFGGLLAIVMATLLAARLRRNATVDGDPPAARWRQWLVRWRPWHGCLAGAVLIGGTGVYWLWREYLGQQRVIAELQTTIRQAQSVPRETRAVYGAPPRPVQPFRPKRLGGTYYRGNLERHPALFNGGNYRTATLGLSLLDAAGNELAVGSPIADGRLVIRLEIARAANVPEVLLGDTVMSQWFVSAQDLTGPEARMPADIVRFAALEPGQRWVADFPLALTQQEAAGFGGRPIYVYRAPAALAAGAPIRAECQYGIAHALPVTSGRLSADAELWMGSLKVSDDLALPQPRRIPLEEWFDDRPIPELPSSDPVDPYGPGSPAPFASFGNATDADD
jgi:hypothetical protein